MSLLLRSFLNLILMPKINKLEELFWFYEIYSFLISSFSSSDIMQTSPVKIITAPIHQVKLVCSPNMKEPRRAETKKFDAVDITVGTNAELVSLEWSPLTKYRQTKAFEVNMRVMKNPFWSSDVSWKKLALKLLVTSFMHIKSNSTSLHFSTPPMQVKVASHFSSFIFQLFLLITKRSNTCANNTLSLCLMTEYRRWAWGFRFAASASVLDS